MVKFDEIDQFKISIIINEEIQLIGNDVQKKYSIYKNNNLAIELLYQ